MVRTLPTRVAGRPPLATSASMVPHERVLPDVLPTDRLGPTGMPVPELRAALRRIDDVRNAGSVLLCWAQAVGTIAATVAAASWAGRHVGPTATVAASLLGIVFMGPVFARLAILGHEAAHKLLFTNKRANDLVGAWLLSSPAFVPFRLYRRSHFAHHKEEFGPTEPDLAFYVGYPISPASMRRKFTRDALGVSGWKNLKVLLVALTKPSSRPFALPIVAAQAVVVATFWLAGRPELYLILWLAPWMTSWRVLNRLRAIAEHGGMEASRDRRRTTHHVRQSLAARFWIVPFHTGWHLAHHSDMGVPWRQLPALHAELVAAGWVVPELEYRSYRTLWRAMAGGTGSTGGQRR